MNCETFRESLADFIGGELDARRQAVLREHLNACPACRELSRDLEESAAEVAAAAPPLDEAQRRTAALAFPSLGRTSPTAVSAVNAVGIPGISQPPRRWAALLRLAAVFVLAFGGGYLARGWRTGENGHNPQLNPKQTAEVKPAPPGAPAVPEVFHPQYANRLERAARRYPGSPTFSRSLLALASR